MGAPEIIMICMLAANSGLVIAKNGQTRKYDAVTTVLVDLPITVGLLIWGGFFG